jgi:hypothetical protein
MFVRLSNSRLRGLLVLAAVSTLIVGCAGTPPQPKFEHTMVVDSRITASDTADVVIQTADKVNVLPVERERVAEKIKAKIEERKLKNPGTPSPRAMQVVLEITRYEKGNAFARAMLAGLGQIHLDGKISVYRMPDHVLLEDFDLQKTFAWGGVYGASTSMEQIEDTFADGVAATVTGQQQSATPSTADAGTGKTTR